jgi:protocatechuate 3,4-dioxygenase beta subunit
VDGSERGDGDGQGRLMPGARAHRPSASSPVSEELAAMLSTCTVSRPWAEQDEGPYHRDAQPLRRDVAEDREGVPLQLGIRITDEAGGALHRAIAEIWHCDALGRYSGFPPPDGAVVTAASAPRTEYLPDETFLRGRQVADAAGMVEFHTIYPGWYPGRTVHIHLMVHLDDVVLTSQLYFPDDVNDMVLARPPYRERPGRDTTNATDTIFPTGGDPAVVDLTQVGRGHRAAIGLVVPTAGAGQDRPRR